MSTAQGELGGLAVEHEPARSLSLNLTWLLLAMLGIGVVIVIVFGFYIDSSTFTSIIRNLIASGWLHPTHPSGQVEHWRLWELGAVLWSFFFGAYYYVTFPMVKSSTFIKVICALVFVGTILPNIVAAYLILNLYPAQSHVAAVLAAGVFFALADFLIYYKHDDPRERGSYFEGLLMADIPMVVGFSVLLLYLVLHQSDSGIEAFAGGAITFQLIAANVIFLLSQGGFIRWVWERHVPLYWQAGTLASRGRQLAPPGPWVVALRTCCLAVPILQAVWHLDGARHGWLMVPTVIVSLAAIGAGLLARSMPICAHRRLLAKIVLAVGAFGLLGSMVPPRPEGHMTWVPEVEPVTAVAVSLGPDGGRLARASETGLEVFRLHKGRAQKDFVDSRPVLALAFSGDGTKLATGGRDPRGKDLAVLVWDMETKQVWRQMILKADPAAEQTGRTDMRAIAISATGDLLAAGGDDHQIRVIDARGLKVVSTLSHSEMVRVLALSPNGRWLVGCAEDNVVKLWDLKDPSHPSEEFVNRLVDGAIFAVDVADDGEYVTGLSDGRVLLWRSPAMSPSLRMSGVGGAVRAVRFIDDKFIASASETSGITWWNRFTAHPTHRAAGGTAAAEMSLAPDGLTWAGGSSVDDRTFWRTE